jgi:hypothetical protein
VPWPDVPTIYPPGAQLLYRLAYALAPHNVWIIKAEMGLWDLLAGLVVALLLRRRGKDPRRAFIYLWAPLAVVEFSLNGHVDAAAVALTALALLVSTAGFRGARALLGVLLGAATLVKLYPLVFVAALARRRDWSMLGALALTLVAGYAPYWREGFNALGFLDVYLSQVQINYGGALLFIRWAAFTVHLTIAVVQALGVASAALGVAVVIWLRLRPASRVRSLGPRASNLARLLAPAARLLHNLDARVPAGVRLSSIGATGVLVVAWLAFSPHVFAWYVAALLPFCALYLGSPASTRWPVAALSLGAWSFVGLIPLSYMAFETPSLAWMYPAIYLAALAVLLGCAARILLPTPTVLRGLHLAGLAFPFGQVDRREGPPARDDATSSPL